MKMVPCKFQTDSTGLSMLVYSEGRAEVFATLTDAELIKPIVKHLGISNRMGKAFAMGHMDKNGVLNVGDVLPDQGW